MAPPTIQAGRARFASIFESYFEFTARLLLRLGVQEDDVEDALQEVFLVVESKLDQVAPGSERSYVYGTAMRVASNLSRVQRRAKARFQVTEAALVDLHASGGPAVDEMLDQKRARSYLDELISTMSLELRAVFTLFELDGMTTSEIAACTGLPTGTVASRLRRAREQFNDELEKLRARLPPAGQEES